MKLRSSWPTVVFTIRLIRGRGKLSFGQSRHFPFAFFTRTTLASRSGYSTSRIVTSSLIAFFPFWGETSSFLFDGFEGRTDVQLVCDYCRVNSPISSCF